MKKIKYIECSVHNSAVINIVGDLFMDRFLYGWGDYRVNHERSLPSLALRKFYWAETFSGRSLDLRQIDPLRWKFSASFPNGGSLRFAWEVNSLLALHKAKSKRTALVSNIKLILQE